MDGRDDQRGSGRARGHSRGRSGRGPVEQTLRTAGRTLAVGAVAAGTAFGGPRAWARAAGRGLRAATRREVRRHTREKEGTPRLGCVVMLVMVLALGTVVTIGGTVEVANQAASTEEEAETEAQEALADGVLAASLVPEVAELTGIPEDALMAYASASQPPGADWAILAGIGMVECSHGTNTAAGCNPNLIDSTTGQPEVNSAGARGPMQFRGGTWRAGSVNTDPDVSGPPVPEDSEGGGYATDGDGDGIADPWNWFDATHSTARYLMALGIEDDPECAVFGYNQGGGVECDPGHDYPTKVMQYADEYRAAVGQLEPTGSASPATGECSGPVTGGRSPYDGDHITTATRQMVDGVIACFGRGAHGIGCYDPRADDPRYEHPRGRACDLMTSGGGEATGVERARGDAMAAWLQANADELNILYVIWWRRIWDPSMGDVPLDQWRPYSGASDHTNHVHVSIALMPGDPSWAQCNPNYSCSE